AQNESATMFMLLLAAFNVLLFRYCGQRDLVVGTPIGNRLRAELEPLIGFFVNTLALRAHISPSMSFRELLLQVRETTLGAYAHLLGAIADGPDIEVGALAMLDSSDLAALLIDWNATETTLAGGTLHGCIFEQAARTPEHTAVVAGQKRVSYRELAARAAGLA